MNGIITCFEELVIDHEANNLFNQIMSDTIPSVFAETTLSNLKNTVRSQSINDLSMKLLNVSVPSSNSFITCNPFFSKFSSYNRYSEMQRMFSPFEKSLVLDFIPSNYFKIIQKAL